MIHVIASIGVKPGKRAAFIKIFKANVPAVQAEDGCVEYIPTIDTNSGIEAQWKDETVVTIIEKWKTIEALHVHLAASHMEQFKKDTANLVEDVSLTVLEDA
ncbi:putative quinol monooxygenase [Pontiella sulfatireligans]|uniref:Putative quinol monooxygenase YgiN n=1 Tax=Pontiella sulfatireligans TaxID=2750658 RepID=A0A6C2UPU5_9BACT|nr:putative quinol monooxygenase [Pontiella sulfatireligans]VGO21337.1 putative quinol monooxygenase YgiN [Pontiella sulfatireligans]